MFVSGRRRRRRRRVAQLRHQGLLSLLALLRLDKLSALNKEKLVPAKLKRIFGAQDSFLNAESAIAKVNYWGYFGSNTKSTPDLLSILCFALGTSC